MLTPALRLALYQPDMPPNTGAMIRLCACLNVGLDIIEPCGFVLDDKKLKRVAMDYTPLSDIKRHTDWDAFKNQVGTKRIVLLTTKANTLYHHFAFQKDDILMVGRESAGVPPDIHQTVDAEIRIPMQAAARSLNVGMAAAIVLAEALKQTDSFP
jgi:tRNA (cytidine/uridine-2'-O-)-methyltransferase